MAVRERIEVDVHLPRVAIPAEVLNEIRTHALETDPEECCGLVTGTDSRPWLTVYRCRNEMTRKHNEDPTAFPRDSFEAYYMNEIDYLQARDDAETRAEHVTGVYHSHVGAGAYFSEMDQEFADQELFPFPNAVQIVVSVSEGRIAQVGVFLPDGPEGGLRGRLAEEMHP